MKPIIGLTVTRATQNLSVILLRNRVAFVAKPCSSLDASDGPAHSVTEPQR